MEDVVVDENKVKKGSEGGVLVVDLSAATHSKSKSGHDV